MQVGLIGCGVMGSVFARKIGKKASWILYSRTRGKAEKLAGELDGQVAAGIEDLAKKCDVIIVAVLPSQVEAISKHDFGQNKLIISIVGGVKLEKWKLLFPSHMVARVLPNLPIAYGEGVVGVVDELEDRKVVETLVDGMGLIMWLSEEKLEALSALAGSGCGFAYMILEAYTEAGIMMGLTSDEALKMAAQSLKGAAVMCEQTGEHPAKLKWEVAAPGGTTIGGLVEMEASGVRAGIIDGILETRARAEHH